MYNKSTYNKKLKPINILNIKHKYNSLNIIKLNLTKNKC